MRELQMKLINDPSTARWFQLLNILEQKHVVTTLDLAKQIGISQRTIITDIQTLKKHFGESAHFISSKNGYHFQEQNMPLYNQKKQELLANEPIYEIIGNIFYGELDSIADTAHYLNYSPGSLRRILSSIQPILRTYNLKLSMNPINICGDESSIRKFFLDFYYEGFQTPHTLHPPQGFHEEFLRMFDSYGEYIELDTGSPIACFYYTLYIVIERFKQGYTVQLPSTLTTLVYKEKDFSKLTLFLSHLGEKYGFTLPKHEIAWIHYTILTKRPIREKASEELFYARFGQWPEIEHLAASLITYHAYSDWDIEQLTIFFKSFLLAKKINDAICPTLNRTMTDTITSIKKSHPDTFRQNMAFLKKHVHDHQFSSHFWIDIAADLTAYCHILAIRYSPRKNVYFLLEGDHLITQTIRAQATYYLGNSHSLFFMSIWSLSHAFLQDNQVDLVITNYEPYVSEYLRNKDYLLTNTILHRHDWQKIFSCLSLSWNDLLYL